MQMQIKVGQQIADRFSVGSANVVISHMRKEVGDCIATITDLDNKHLGTMRVRYDPKGNIMSVDPPSGQKCQCDN